MSKVVRISEENYQKVAQAGAFNESFDNVLSKLLEKVSKLNLSVEADYPIAYLLQVEGDGRHGSV